MIIKVIDNYYDAETNHYFKIGEIYTVEDKFNSLFYHIWGRKQLLLIPKTHCMECLEKKL